MLGACDSLTLAGAPSRSDFQAAHHSLSAKSISFPEDHNFMQGPPTGVRQYRNLRHNGSMYLAQRWTTVLGPERYHPT